VQVATRIEVHVGSVPETGPSDDQILWRRLGGLSLDNNERSNFQARELKNVQLHADAVYLRLVIHRCHVNKLNIYNQVSVCVTILFQGAQVRRLPCVVNDPAGHIGGCIGGVYCFESCGHTTGALCIHRGPVCG
jgi:hypothetical protein